MSRIEFGKIPVASAGKTNYLVGGSEKKSGGSKE